MSSIKWKAARDEMILDPTVCMLNTGSFGPLPKPVFDRATQLRLQLAAGPTNFFVRQAPPLLWQARERTAAFLGAHPACLVFTTNVSAAINLIASGLRIDSPGEILITDHEYGAMIWCWERAARHLGLTLRTFPLPTMTSDPMDIVNAATRAMSSQTRLFFFSHVLSPTGLILPARELCRAARERGITTVVDGAHAPAMIPLDVDAVGADFYTGNLHKWLLAPIGSGFLVIGPGNHDKLEPLHVSWGYHKEIPKGGAEATDPLDRPDRFGSTARVRYLEFEGTRDICPWLAVPAAIDFQAELGWNNIRDRMAELAAYTRQTIGKLGLTLATPPTQGLHGAMTAFELPPGLDPEHLRNQLWSRRIEIPIIERADRLLIRVSHHFYTTHDEIDQLAVALRMIL